MDRLACLISRENLSEDYIFKNEQIKHPTTALVDQGVKVWWIEWLSFIVSFLHCSCNQLFCLLPAIPDKKVDNAIMDIK